MTLIWNDEAEAEFSDAADYYEQQGVGLGDRFASHIEATVARILCNPFMPRCFDSDCRKVRTDRFPYIVIYLVEGENVQIISVMHTSRHPGYWKSRLKSD